jgi:hypothetical protein
MQAVATLKGYSRREQSIRSDLTFALAHLIGRVFGCAHNDMSRPFSRHGEAYRVCIACGAHRRFDQKAWTSRGPFYYQAARTEELLETDGTALRSV